MTFVQLGKSGLFLPEHSSGAIVSLLFLLFICMDVTSRRREKKGVCVRGREREVGGDRARTGAAKREELAGSV